ncbi:PEP/pyruvate-binding domain-containing protein [Gordonia sp. VNQ95]|uniref:PEP/pyruvate-binding domain-containing protein n=1 Tax=Gordonia sp. VNQ95 TaxID=3156619 RepID=UPI0032B33629
MIARVTAESHWRIDDVGGKTLGLVRLLRAGLPVPDAWVIPASDSRDEVARRRCLDALTRWWRDIASVWPESRWAVRSSAVAEDLDGASFAGVYETVLGVGSPEELAAAVRRCWDAHAADRAEVYRGERDIDAAGGIALVVQRMLMPDAAGVMLTANPHRPFADEIVIDAAWGLGESVVSGIVDPDHIVLQRSDGSVRHRRIASKEVETVYSDGLQTRPVAESRRTRPALDEAGIAALYAISRTVGTRIGQARDIEWAVCDGQVYVLQDRPMTAIPSVDPTTVFSRRWGDEYKSEYSLPLSSAVINSWMDIPLFVELPRLQKRADLAAREPFILFNGYMYMDGDYAVGMARSLPKGMREGVFSAWFTPMWLRHIESADWSPRLTLEIARSFRRDRDRAGQHANLAGMRHHGERVESVVAPLLTQDYRALDSTEWRRQYDELESMGVEHFRLLRWGMGMHNTMLHRLLPQLLAAWVGDDDGRLYTDLISGLPGTRTAQINREIYQLARTALRDSEFAAQIGTTEDWAALRRDTDDHSFWTRFDAFLARHGHRADSRDVAALRWREQPEVIFGFVRAQVLGGAADPDVGESRAAALRAEAMSTVLGRAGRGPLGRIRTGILEWAIRWTQEFTVYRENQRYLLDYLLAHARSLILARAYDLVEAGVIADADDVFLLTDTEWWGALSRWEGVGVPIDPEQLERRRQNYLTYRNRLPATYLFDDVETEGEIAEGDAPTDDDTDGLVGVAAARGVATGPTRAVTDITELADVRAGDILVAKNIDPGWTAVFPLLGGLITETGGVLSHGAILAREYGIPTVTGIPHAVSRFAAETVVEVDGGRGVVTVVEDPITDVIAGVPDGGREASAVV